MNLKELKDLVAQGEGPMLEFKRSTGELAAAMKTACAFLNADGGRVIFGARHDGELLGQEVSDSTLRDLAQMTAKIEPTARMSTQRVRLRSGSEIVILHVDGTTDGVPYTFDGRAYERVEATTRQMAKEKVERLILDQMHSRRRWENQPAEGTTIRDIDRDEVFRILGFARAAGRLVGPAERDLGAALDRFEVRKDGEILRAAVVLFGKRPSLGDFPQCEIQLARFRGLDKDEFLDQKNVRGPAFKLLEEALIFCDRHFPLRGQVLPDRLRRLDTPLIPPEALREILINALIHRDYTIFGSNIWVAIFDDRVEIWSPGGFPTGVTASQLSRTHRSVRRNPYIADAFFRAGLIEKWGRGTNRVIKQCREHGIPAPEFEVITESVVVTFRVPVGRTVRGTPQVTGQVTPQVTEQVTGQVTEQVETCLAAAVERPRSRLELQRLVRLKHRTHFQDAYLNPLIALGWLEMTIPDKPNSRLQRYRTTPAGLEALSRRRRRRRS